jgi:gamma-glutamyltranspeptidase/glutathione hydrolase
VAVPGLVQGLEEVHQRFGVLPWEDVVAPAIRLCRDGVPIGPHHLRILGIVKKRFGDDYPETIRTQFLPGGKLPELGSRLRQPDLEKTLRAIARKGSKALTTGPIADSIVEAARAHGGILTLEDLQKYYTEWREPVRGTYRGHDIVSMPPPSSGGVHLIQMLNALEPYDLKALGHNSSEYIHQVSEVMKVAFADRAAHLGDPDFYPVPTEWLVSKAYGLEIAERVRPRAWYAKPPWRWGKPVLANVKGPGAPPPNDAGTTHISVLDVDGNAVSLTQTVNTLFGSRITVPGTGIVLNNEMDDFSASPEAVNLWGVQGNAANSIAPRKRPLSSMTPTIVLKDGEPWLISGSPMGPLIITTVLQTVVNTIDFGMDVQSAVVSPRFHHQWRPDRIAVERAHPRDVIERLEAIGHQVYVSPYGFGASATIQRDPLTGIMWGSVDPRRDTAAGGP